MKTTASCIFTLLLAGTTAHVSAVGGGGTPLYTNLIANPDAEASAGAADFGSVAAPVGWTTSSNFTAVPYGIGSNLHLNMLDSAAIGGGLNYFAGGPDTALATAFQSINFSDLAAAVDAGSLAVQLTALLGGYLNEADNMSLTATFRDASDASLGAFSLGPVTPAQRVGMSQLRYRFGRAVVPVGARTADIVLTATRVEGSYNDGYADNLSFQLAPAQSTATFAGTSTAIPGGTGTFTSLGAPSLSGGKVAFLGTGTGGQSGIYRIIPQEPTIPQEPIRIADLNTSIPNGTGNFTGLSAPRLSGNNVAFHGMGTGGQNGIYVTIPQDPVSPQDPIRIADLTTAIPNGTGNFTAFTIGTEAPAPKISGESVVFLGAGMGGQQGVYGKFGGALLRLADTATSIPGGTGTFSSFGAVALPQDPLIPQDPTAPQDPVRVGFIGFGAGGQQGIYDYSAGTLSAVFNTATAIPSGTGTFTGFGSLSLAPQEPTAPQDPLRAAFIGLGSGGQQGVYSTIDTPLALVADLDTPIPFGLGNFTGFETVSASETDVAFLATGDGGQLGIYNLLGGSLLKVVDLSDTIDGKTIIDLDLTSTGAFNPIAYQATFSDGSQGIYTSTPAPEPGSAVLLAGGGVLLGLRRRRG